MNPVWQFLNGVPKITAPVTFGVVTLSTTGLTSTGPISESDALALGTTPTMGMAVENTTAAAAGAQQISTSFDWVGQGWKTNATAASQEVRFRADVLPVQGAAAPTGTWRLGVQVAGGAITYPLTVSSAEGTGVTVIGALATSGGSGNITASQNII